MSKQSILQVIIFCLLMPVFTPISSTCTRAGIGRLFCMWPMTDHMSIMSDQKPKFYQLSDHKTPRDRSSGLWANRAFCEWSYFCLLMHIKGWVIKNMITHETLCLHINHHDRSQGILWSLSQWKFWLLNAHKRVIWLITCRNNLLIPALVLVRKFGNLWRVPPVIYPFALWYPNRAVFLWWSLIWPLWALTKAMMSNQSVFWAIIWAKAWYLGPHPVYNNAVYPIPGSKPCMLQHVFVWCLVWSLVRTIMSDQSATVSCPWAFPHRTVGI